MSSFAVFDCTAVLSPDKVKAFKDLFYHSGNPTKEFNFGIIANLSEKMLSNGNVLLNFDCQNSQGIYYGWYKPKPKNMETYCRELDVKVLMPFAIGTRVKWIPKNGFIARKQD